MAAARILVLRLDASDPSARLGQWLLEAGVELDERALDAGDELPPDLSAHDGLLVLGGAMGAWDDTTTPYLPAVRRLLRDAVSAEVPTLGVCLGHQLLAAANGGQVRRMPDGPEVGALLVAKRSVAVSDPLFGAMPITPDVLQWHYDEVSVLPQGAVQLASSPECEQQAFRLGRVAWGIQFHIETTPQMVTEWAAERDEALDDYDMDAILARALAVHDDLEEVWQPFAARFADIVRDPSSAPSVAGPAATDPMAAARAALAGELNAARAPLPMPGMRPHDDG